MEQLLHYLKTHFGNAADMHTIPPPKTLSFALQGNYHYFEVSALGETFLAIAPLQSVHIKNLSANMRQIQTAVALPVVALLDDCTPYQMKKMLHEKTPFVIANKQLYLPFMALHLQYSRAKAAVVSPQKPFTTATQLLFLWILYAPVARFTAEELATQLQLSMMTISRGTGELQRLGLLSCEIGGQTGRKKTFVRIAQRDYYQLGKARLQNPIKEIFFVREPPALAMLYKSGLTALGEQTMLAEPPQTIVATYEKAAQQWRDTVPQISKEEAQECGGFEIHLLKYNPALLATGTYADPITMILGLGETDERIEQAIEMRMEETQWYEA